MAALWPVYCADAVARLAKATIISYDRCWVRLLAPRFGDMPMDEIRLRLVALCRVDMLAKGIGRRAMVLLQVMSPSESSGVKPNAIQCPSCASRAKAASALPVMADDSSRRAVQNAFSLVYGLKLPSDIYASYAFATRLGEAGRPLPEAHIIAKNRLTQYMGPASAYGAVRRSIDHDVRALLKSHPEKFTFETLGDGVVNIRDFQTTGVVAFARGCPFYALQSGRLDVMGQRIQVNEPYRLQCVEAMQELVSKL